MLTPKETGGRGGVYPVRIGYSALCESGFTSTGAPAENATMALGWKPTAVDTAYPLCDPTNHYLLTIRKAGATVTVWKQDVELGSYTTTATTYAGLLAEALAAYAGNASGYFSRLVVVESALDYSRFYQLSPAAAGVWVPRRLAGMDAHTLLEFTDAANLGADSSGSGNHWTLTGAAQSVDTPTNNYATLNPLGGASSVAVLSDGLLSITGDGVGAPWSKAVSTLGATGKVYWEVTLGQLTAQNYTVAGMIVAPGGTTQSDYPGITADGWGIQSFNGNLYLYHNGTYTNLGAWGDAYAGDVFGLAVDPELGNVWVRKNDTAWFGCGDPESGSLPTFSITPGLTFMAVAQLDSVGKSTVDFGQNGYAYPAPAGFLPLCSTNLPEPETLDAGKVSEVVLRTGTGASVSITSLPFAPDFVNIKSRSNQDIWVLSDTARGAGHYLSTNYNNANATSGYILTAFLSNGYSLGTHVAVNRAAASFVDVALKADLKAGFQVVRYTGDGESGRTIAHDLNKVPTFIMVKRLDAAADWKIYHQALGAGKSISFTYAVAAVDATIWNDTEPTSAVITLGDNAAVNASGGEYIAYIFTDSDVFRAWSFIGNANADGPFVDLGGRPLSLLFYKNAEWGSSPWYNYDAVRDPYNSTDDILNPNLYAAEQTNNANYKLAFTSRGFKPLTANAGYNSSTQRLIGLALLDQTKYANAF
ncbi:DUF7483 domain-containing protein [Pseudodesulfovibrio karagichevae]|uniref:B30.2/SPRY domain-containing protein n=1 Tax=Pseudodesulfovibrio karagichevae TaxID=3239305 RepID=A0ABV4K8X8_9BACT